MVAPSGRGPEVSGVRPPSAPVVFLIAGSEPGTAMGVPAHEEHHGALAPPPGPSPPDPAMRPILRSAIPTVLVLVGAALASVPTAPPAASPPRDGLPERPNILLILSDDQSWSGLSVPMHPTERGASDERQRTPRIAELAAACADGVFLWGANDQGQCGAAAADAIVPRPRRFERVDLAPNRVVALACGASHVAILVAAESRRPGDR